MFQPSTHPSGIITVVLTIVIFGHFSAGQDEVPGFYIEPRVATKNAKGITLLLTCHYPKHISNIVWLDPSGKEQAPYPGDEIEGGNGGKSRLKLENLSLKQVGKYGCKGYRKGNFSDPIVLYREVTVYEPIEFVDTQLVQPFNLGSNAAVDCNVYGTPSPEVVWKRDNQSFTSKNVSDRLHMDESNRLVIMNIRKSDEATYKCEATESSHGQFKDTDIYVDVQFAPSQVIISDEVIGTQGNDVTLMCSAVAEPEPTYRWYRGNADDIFNATPITKGLKEKGTKLVIEKVDESDKGNYTCLVSNTRGNATNTATVIIHVPPVIDETKNATVKMNRTASIECTASGIPKPTITIYRHDELLNESSLRDPTPVIPYYEPGKGTITFDRASNTDAGEYRCVATNNAGNATAKLGLTVLYKPLDRQLPTVYACPNEKATLTCQFDAYPAADLQWGTMVNGTPPNGSFAEIESMFTKPKMVSVFKSFDSNSSAVQKGKDGSLQYIIPKTTENSYRKYRCTAKNSEGSNSADSELAKATVPDAPINVKLVKVTTRSAVISYSPPANIHVAIKKYIFNVTNLNTKRPSTSTFTQAAGTAGNTAGEKLKIHIRKLQHDTNYNVHISAENCMGYGALSEPLSVNTHRIVNPPKVEFVRPRNPIQYNNYTVQWETQGDGGGVLQNITIKYKPVTQGNTSEDKEALVSIVIDKKDPDFISQSYHLTNLQPSTKYEGSITITNDVGSAETPFYFETPAVPTAPPSTTEDGKDKLVAGGIAPVMIPIIVAVVILLLIIIDAICCASRHCGFIHCMYTICCASGSNKEGLNDAEEGSAEYRQEMGVVNEETPLHADQSNGDTAPDKKPEKEPKKEEKELSPEDVKTEVCASEKEPLA